MSKAAADVIQAAREHTVAAVARLVALMQQDDDRNVALAAANALLDRGYGRPPQAVLAQVHASTVQCGIDKPPEITECYEDWLQRRRQELDLLESKIPDRTPCGEWFAGRVVGKR
jgi:hypothetical protein